MQSLHLYPANFQHFNLTRFDTGGSTSLRSGDWICLNCRNFNYAFRMICNRCKLQSKGQNMELQTLMRSYEANARMNQFALQNYQMEQMPTAEEPKVWFDGAPETTSFASVLFLQVSELTVRKQFESTCLKPKLSICSALTMENSEDERTFKSESKENNMEWEMETTEDGDEGCIDSYLLKILDD